MLTPSDKKILITKAIEVLKCAEGVDRPFLKEMTELLESAEEEEWIFMLEQDDYAQSMEDQAIQQGIDKARGK